jgi:hypothetical protein
VRSTTHTSRRRDERGRVDGDGKSIQKMEEVRKRTMTPATTGKHKDNDACNNG